MTPLLPDAVAEAEAFLRRHVSGSMFALVNLAGRGVQMRSWWGEDGFLGLTETGMVLAQLPSGRVTAAARCLERQSVTGVLGPAGQVRPLIAAMGLDRAPHLHDKDEPGYTLDLGALDLPSGPGELIRPDPSQRELLEAWRAAYLAEVFGTPPEEAESTARRDVKGWFRRESHRLLMVEGQPRAITGFNAMLPDVVQVGGVFTPPDQRGQGWARRALALHLRQARASGVGRAVLFAATAAAERAYRAIGFQPEGGMTLVLFNGAQVVRCR